MKASGAPVITIGSRQFPLIQTVASVVAIVGIAAFPWLGLLPYYLQLAEMFGIIFILLTGLNIIFGYAGQISIAQMGFYGVGAYTAALLQVKLGMPFPVSFIGSILAPAALAAIIGTPILRLKGFYLALGTIGLGVMLYELFEQWQDLTGGPIGVLGMARPEYLGGASNPMPYYYFIWIVAILAFLFVRNLANSAFGRALMAIRENDVAASSLGINLARTKLIAFVISAGLGGMAGCLYGYLNLYISPDSFAMPNSMILVASLIIGGAGTLIGAACGTVMWVIIPELAQARAEFSSLIFGLALVIILLFLPNGIWGYLSSRFSFRPAAPAVTPSPSTTPSKPAKEGVES